MIKTPTGYRLNLPVLRGIEFTETSQDFLLLHQAVEFARQKKSVLQSQAEAIAYRIDASTGYDDDRAYEADRPQLTRTAMVVFMQDGKLYYAFDDAPNPGQNIIVARAQEGYRDNMNGKEWILPKTDYHVAQILKRAEKDYRIVEGVLENGGIGGKANCQFTDLERAVLMNVSQDYNESDLAEKKKTLTLSWKKIVVQTWGAIIYDARLGGRITETDVFVKALQLPDRTLPKYKYLYRAGGFNEYGLARGIRQIPE